MCSTVITDTSTPKCLLDGLRSVLSRSTLYLQLSVLVSGTDSPDVVRQGFRQLDQRRHEMKAVAQQRQAVCMHLTNVANDRHHAVTYSGALRGKIVAMSFSSLHMESHTVMTLASG